MSVKVLTIPHITDENREREEFFCPLLDSAGVCHILRIEKVGTRAIKLVGMTSSRAKLWETQTIRLEDQNG